MRFRTYGSPITEFRERATALGLSHQAVSKAATHGEQAAARWKAVWKRLR